MLCECCLALLTIVGCCANVVLLYGRLRDVLRLLSSFMDDAVTFVNVVLLKERCCDAV